MNLGIHIQKYLQSRMNEKNAIYYISTFICTHLHSCIYVSIYNTYVSSSHNTNNKCTTYHI